ncbi:MAG: hypothetical protein DDT19_02128 [Syntrophomonadaceae bacterium]|nr:hypothetical protein [Bacillota bacterium]
MKYSPRSKAENLNVGIYEKHLPSGIEGFYASDGLDKFIVVDSTLTEIKKNSVITHELIHHQRTPGHQAVAHFSVTEAIPVRKAERKVEKETALALISDRELGKALAETEPPVDLWWLSVHGIYRERSDIQGAELQLLPKAPKEEVGEAEEPAEEELLHPKYMIPARCFAYVGHAGKTTTWKLPYRLIDGSIDEKRLPKAIQAILSNYRGVKVSGIPEEDIPMVLLRLARAAASIGRMPFQLGSTAPVYQQLADVLEQIGLLSEIAKE